MCATAARGTVRERGANVYADEVFADAAEAAGLRVVFSG
jgi:hypothetical protein